MTRARSRRFRRLLQIGPAARAGRDRALPALRLCRARRSRQNQSRHLLAQGRHARRPRPLAAPRRDCRRNRREPGSGARSLSQSRAELTGLIRIGLARGDCRIAIRVRKLAINAWYRADPKPQWISRPLLRASSTFRRDLAADPLQMQRAVINYSIFDCGPRPASHSKKGGRAAGSPRLLLVAGRRPVGWALLRSISVKTTQGVRLKLVQAAGALTVVTGPLAVSAMSISSIVRPRVSKPMNKTATSARTYQAAK